MYVFFSHYILKYLAGEATRELEQQALVRKVAAAGVSSRGYLLRDLIVVLYLFYHQNWDFDSYGFIEMVIRIEWLYPCYIYIYRRIYVDISHQRGSLNGDFSL